MIRQTKEERARQLGFQHFDCTLPQGWLDRTVEIAYGYIVQFHHELRWEFPNQELMPKQEVYDILLAGTIWEYDNEALVGQPAAITSLAEHVLRIAYPEGEFTCTDPGKSATATSQPSRS